MLNLVRLTEGTNLAIHALAYLAGRKKDGLCSATEIAKRLVVSEAHMAKVLQRLARAGIVRSSRGAKGGFTLARDPKELSFYDVLEAIDGPFSPNTCLLGRTLCQPQTCMLKDLAMMIRDYFEKRMIGDFRLRSLPPISAKRST